MKLGIETASLMNHIMTTTKAPNPKVGVGATICLWTDRKAGTIIKVTKTQIHVREDKATRTDTNGMSESQTYTYEPDPEGSVHIFRKTNRGWRDRCGSGLSIGVRAQYHDYSF